MRKHFLIIIPLFLTLFSLNLSVSASGDIGVITTRMKERLPVVVTLQIAGKIGENNSGFIEARETLSSSEKKVVSAENDDRNLIYESVAGNTGGTVAAIGGMRAKQLAGRAPTGSWIQDPDGNWHRKN